MNERIDAEQVRLVNEKGENVGVVAVKDALLMATEADLDLVEVAPEAEPPVCRIMDFGKHKYRLKKKQHQSHVHQHHAQLKALRLSPMIEEHDIQVKLRRAKDFIARGDRVMFNMMFRGRQLMRTDAGYQLLNRLVLEMAEVAKAEVSPRMEGRRLWTVVAPK